MFGFHGGFFFLCLCAWRELERLRLERCLRDCSNCQADTSKDFSQYKVGKYKDILSWSEVLGVPELGSLGF